MLQSGILENRDDYLQNDYRYLIFVNVEVFLISLKILAVHIF